MVSNRSFRRGRRRGFISVFVSSFSSSGTAARSPGRLGGRKNGSFLEGWPRLNSFGRRCRDDTSSGFSPPKDAGTLPVSTAIRG